MTLVQSIRQFVRDEEGTTAIEYGLIIALISIAIIAGATAIGPKLHDAFCDVAVALGGSCAS